MFVCEHVGLHVYSDKVCVIVYVLLWFALLGLRLHVMFESSILVALDSVVATAMATAKVETAMVTVWAMETAVVLTMDTANTEKKTDLQ